MIGQLNMTTFFTIVNITCMSTIVIVNYKNGALFQKNKKQNK